MNSMGVAEYLRIERAADWKHEFDSGFVVDVPHPNRQHIIIGGNVAASLSTQLSDRSAEVYIAQMRVKIASVPFYAYPDVVVSSHPTFEDEVADTLLTPDVVVEVYSESTEAYDRGRKFAHYRKLDSLCEYLLVAQDRFHIEHYVRQADNQWLLSEIDGPDGMIDLPSIGCNLTLSQAYRKVPMSDETST